MINAKVLQFAQILWDYHQLNYNLVKSDCIFVLGSHDLRVAKRAAEIFLDGWAPLLIFSGGLSDLTEKLDWSSEAEEFARLAIQMGVPRDKILIENQASNTSENVIFTKDLLTKLNLNPQTFILVQKPYMERRALATFQKRWPGKSAIVTSPKIGFSDYPTKEIPLELVINIMVGDLQRLDVYYNKGYLIQQNIPAMVWEAYHQLIELGFTQDLIQE